MPARPGKPGETADEFVRFPGGLPRLRRRHCDRLAVVGRDCEHVVFMLWGNYAREKRTLIDGSKHLVLESPHPSPLSAHKGFFGNNHFKNANAYLEEYGRGTITWC